MEDITIEEFNKRLEAGEKLVVVDVREEWEFDEANLNGILIPLGELRDRLEELDAYRNQEVIVHCRSGKRSETAKKFMLTQGFTHVRNMLGGILAYQALKS
ncbi:MAG: rhodanese-like domain-containing protein [Cytophagales bacterium]|nr:MAG: rhodanese-like domain-containing protein [Cytophagales bacterium]TAF62111.1 MAG: rhodanese-like domain-containing protein [Cytophagales bacterium]